MNLKRYVRNRDISINIEVFSSLIILKGFTPDLPSAQKVWAIAKASTDEGICNNVTAPQRTGWIANGNRKWK